MKRLKNILLAMEPKTETYVGMYEGPMLVIPLAGPSYEDYDNTYYSNSIAYKIERTNKLALDKPTITIQIPTDLFSIKAYTIAAADYCLRALKPYIDKLNSALYNRSRPDRENGRYYLYNPGGEVLMRNTAYFMECLQKDYENGSGNSVYLRNGNESNPPKMCICIRLQVQLPCNRIKKTIQMLCRDLPAALEMFISEFDINKMNEALALAEKQSKIRKWLKNSEYCAFIGDGSILPRLKGTDLPMEDAVPFTAAVSDRIEICGVRGMGIRRGVTVITGGGYSGKSTLLDAISAGIYNHVLGDGRELCITDDSAITISAEDGRSVKSVNISPFIKWLPCGDTSDFSTEHASGATSQAANIMEAVDSGAKLLLIDEDRSATNFMIRDKIMKELIKREPITPFTDRVNELFEVNGVSTILVIGGSGEYLSVADKVYMMDNYVIQDVTENSKTICEKYNVYTKLPIQTNWEQHRVLYSENFSSYPVDSSSEKLEVSDMGIILIGDERIDVRGLHNIATKRQLDTLGYMLRYLEIHNIDKEIDIKAQIEKLYNGIEKEGLDLIFSSYFTGTERFLDLPRKQELIAVINRMRNIKVRNKIEFKSH